MKSALSPLVSICMPHLNSRPFIKERMETILQQTMGDWELIIVDSNSDDGSREVLEKYAGTCPRIRLHQAPRDGIYRNINRALELAQGKYVYIATSDDTMAPDCLERMVGALERNPDCSLSHCCLEIIDANGAPVEPEYAWQNYAVQKYFGEWINKEHVRRAPHDGILHLGLFTIYTSLTQLLVRRSIFKEFGLFRTDCCSYADFEWGMRMGLSQNVVHVPFKLASWRRHDLQATQTGRLLRARAEGEFHRLAAEAIKSLDLRNSQLANRIRQSPLNHYYLVDEMKARRLTSHSRMGRLAGVAGFVAKYPLFSLQWLYRKTVAQKKMTLEFDGAVRDEFTRLGLGNLLHQLN